MGNQLCSDGSFDLNTDNVGSIVQRHWKLDDSAVFLKW